MQSPEDYSHEIYERTIAGLEERYDTGEIDVETLRAELEGLHKYQGLGWDGRNAYKEAEIQGQIDAYQVFLHRIKL